MMTWCIGNGQVHDLRLADLAGTLNCMHDPQVVLHDSWNFMCGKLSGEACAPGCGTGLISNSTKRERESNNIVNEKTYVVRRLTPLECTRLQGYPDGWVDIGDWVDSKGKKHKDADSAKYKALGNSIALPFWYQLLGNISDVMRREDPTAQTHTLGSLFDGIGGFPYCWAMHNGKESVRWNSEIEEFPEAVVTQHFGDEDWGIEGDFDEYFQ